VQGEQSRNVSGTLSRIAAKHREEKSSAALLQIVERKGSISSFLHRVENPTSTEHAHATTHHVVARDVATGHHEKLAIGIGADRQRSACRAHGTARANACHSRSFRAEPAAARHRRLKYLDRAFMLFGRRPARERTKVPAHTGLGTPSASGAARSFNRAIRRIVTHRERGLHLYWPSACPTLHNFSRKSSTPLVDDPWDVMMRCHDKSQWDPQPVRSSDPRTP
jgi:hypothetical protein